MLAAVDEVVNLAQVVPTKRSKPKAAAEAVNQTAQVALMKKKPKKPFKKRKLGKAAEATNRTAQVALMKKKPKNLRKRPGKVVEADPVCAVRTTNNERT
jgi:hypothetical protein